MLFERFGDLPADRQDRVQRGHRLLEDHADIRTADLADFLVRKLQQIPPGKQDFALCDAPGRIRNQAQDRQSPGGLARPAFADNRDRLAALDGVGDAVNRGDDAGPGAKLGVQVPDF